MDDYKTIQSGYEGLKQERMDKGFYFALIRSIIFHLL